MGNKILGIDTSSPALVLALADGEEVLWHARETHQWQHIERILPHIDEGLTCCGWTLDDLDTIACGIGPGSFTGLRVGIAVVKALSLAKKKKIVALSSLESIAAGFSHDGDTGVLLDARRGKTYYAQFTLRSRRLVQTTAACLISPRQLIARLKRRRRVILLSGDGLKTYGEQIKSHCGKHCVFAPEKAWFPRAEAVIACAREKIKHGEYVKVPALLPAYMSLSPAEEARKKQKR
jgi:tRNA threonylcarbamoyladenosine biosynthesis protein TsaB